MHLTRHDDGGQRTENQSRQHCWISAAISWHNEYLQSVDHVPHDVENDIGDTGNAKQS